MKIELFPDPLSAPASIEIHQPMTIDAILKHEEILAPDWFWENGVVLIDNVPLPKVFWSKTVFKPNKINVIELIPVPSGKNFLSIIATVATIAAVAAIGAFGIPFLGIAAGSFWASVAAAGVGLAGQLLSNALSAPPSISNDGSEVAKSQVQSGFSSNVPILNDTLPFILGKVGYSPPSLMYPYSVFTQDQTRQVGVVGHEGRCLIENIKVNGIDSSLIPGLQIETFEGSLGDAPRTIGTDTVVEIKLNYILSEFKTIALSNFGDYLKNYSATDTIPEWHYFKTTGSWDKFTIQLLFPSGIVKTDSADAAMVPVRIEVRKIGDVAWRALPTCHVADYKKGVAPVRCQVTLKRSLLPAGKHYCSARDKFPLFELTNKTGLGQSFQYDSDPYFINDGFPSYLTGGLIPTMTGPTTSGVTMSSSGDFNGSFQAWNASDNQIAITNWAPPYNSLPGAWLKVDFGSPVTARSYTFTHRFSTNPGQTPTQWILEGSNDNATWIDLNDGVVESGPLASTSPMWQCAQIGTPGSYRYYRFTFLKNNGAANEDLHVAHLQLLPFDSPSASFEADDTLVSSGYYARHYSGGNHPRCMYGSLDENGATFYLDPAQWDAGEYEVRIKRGVTEKLADFNQARYAHYGTEVLNADYFEYRTDVNGSDYIYIGQRYFKSDAQVELIQTIDSTKPPFDPSGRTMIAISVPDLVVNSLYAEFTRYAPIYDSVNGIWTEIEVPTSNPAALLRQLKLGGANADPVAGEIIDEDNLAQWYEHCELNGYECNAVIQGATIQEVEQLIASCGYASPKYVDTHGVVMERDTSALPARWPISPINSRDLGSPIAVAKIPDAIIATFSDETDSYMPNSVIVYRDGKTADNAKIYEAIKYAGTTNSAKATARATFDLRQAQIRQVRYIREVGAMGLGLQRGMVVKLSDHKISRNQMSGWIVAVDRSGGFINSITLDNIINWSAASELESIEDVMSLTDVVNPTQPMGLCIGLSDVEYQVSNITDSNVCTFTTPIADDPDIDINVQVLCGNMSNTHKRVIVMSVIPTGHELFQVVLADEANELFL